MAAVFLPVPIPSGDLPGCGYNVWLRAFVFHGSIVVSLTYAEYLWATFIEAAMT